MTDHRKDEAAAALTEVVRLLKDLGNEPEALDKALEALEWLLEPPEERAARERYQQLRRRRE
jgi:hypothetical protein